MERGSQSTRLPCQWIAPLPRGKRFRRGRADGWREPRMRLVPGKVEGEPTARISSPASTLSCRRTLAKSHLLSLLPFIVHNMAGVSSTVPTPWKLPPVHSCLFLPPLFSLDGRPWALVMNSQALAAGRAGLKSWFQYLSEGRPHASYLSPLCLCFFHRLHGDHGSSRDVMGAGVGSTWHSDCHSSSAYHQVSMILSSYLILFPSLPVSLFSDSSLLDTVEHPLAPSYLWTPALSFSGSGAPEGRIRAFLPDVPPSTQHKDGSK